MAKESKKKINKGSKPTKGKEIESIMGNSAKTESLPIADGLMMYLYSAGDTGGKYIRVDFSDYSTYKDYAIVVDRFKLRDIADFIYKYLENK